MRTSPFFFKVASSVAGTRQTMVFDDGPAILRALNSIAYYHSEHTETNAYLGGAIYIPPAQQAYIVNSYLPVPRQVTIWRSGNLGLNESMSLAGSDNWFGDWGSAGTPQFGGYSGAGGACLGLTPLACSI